MAKKNEAEFSVNIPVEGDDPLRGKFKVKVKLSYRDILNMDAMRRQLLGPGGNDADGLAAVLASSLAKIRTHAIETPSWWKDAQDGLEFDDLEVVFSVARELAKVEKDHLAELTALATKATDELKQKQEKEAVK